MVEARENAFLFLLRPEDPRLNGLEIAEFGAAPQGTVGPVPQKVTLLQGRTQLRRHRLPDGSNLDDQIIALLTGAVQQASVLPPTDPMRIAAEEDWIAYTTANDLERNSAIVAKIGAIFQLDDAMLDRMFRAASMISK